MSDYSFTLIMICLIVCLTVVTIFRECKENTVFQAIDFKNTLASECDSSFHHMDIEIIANGKLQYHVFCTDGSSYIYSLNSPDHKIDLDAAYKKCCCKPE